MNRTRWFVVGLAALVGGSLGVWACRDGGDRPPSTLEAAHAAGETPDEPRRAPIDGGARACDHPYSTPAGGRLVYELRAGGDRERLVFEAEADDGFTTRWSAAHTAAGGQRRTGRFETQCTGQELELPLDSFATAGDNRLRLHLPRFPIPDRLEAGDRWCREEPVHDGVWERCVTVVGPSVVETPAGRFDAVEIVRTDSVELGPRHLTERAHVWLVEGIGVVRLAREGSDATTELVEHTL